MTQMYAPLLCDSKGNELKMKVIKYTPKNPKPEKTFPSLHVVDGWVKVLCVYHLGEWKALILTSDAANIWVEDYSLFHQLQMDGMPSMVYELDKVSDIWLQIFSAFRDEGMLPHFEDSMSALNRVNGRAMYTVLNDWPTHPHKMLKRTAALLGPVGLGIKGLLCFYDGSLWVQRPKSP